MFRKKSISFLIILFLGALIISYIATKATITSFTHDESITYTHYVHTSFMDIISYKDPFTNNHILNTLLMKCSEFLFGNSELALRLPNLILLLVYLIYTFFLFQKTNKILSVCMFLFMCSSLYMMDFFGLARGYGLSYGFMIMSLYHLIKSLEINRNKNLILFNVAALLATLSNFTLLYFYIAALVAYNIFFFINKLRFDNNTDKKENFFRINLVSFILFAFAAIVLYEPLRKILKFKVIDFGGKEGFMENTVTSLIYKYFYTSLITPLGNIFLKIIILIPIIISLFLIIKNIYHAKKEFFDNAKALIIVNLILLIIPVESIIQHYLLGSDYFFGRFALFLIPLFVLNIAFLLDYWFKIKNRFRIIIISVAILLALLSVNNFCKGIDFYSSADWSYDAETKNAIKELIAYHNKVKPETDSVKIGINWVFEPTINYYRQTFKINWLLLADRNGLTADDNYCYIFQEDMDTLKHKNYKVIFSSDKTETVLIKITE